MRTWGKKQGKGAPGRWRCRHEDTEQWQIQIETSRSIRQVYRVRVGVGGRGVSGVTKCQAMKNSAGHVKVSV